ncbi:hypothetical protein OJAV_G00126280 [Oryzias javanicus]|uniref:Uncharacterized protein n=1 Tax=Oryzias javanicus TaxID=123683 RepID=A0A3S2MQK6_ORYJA|nr:hypothetical protein OJAV_G00126280 [Oryzias javanicus]
MALRETGPLMKGLRSLNSLSEMLLITNADIILPGCQTFDDIRQEIEEMKQHLEESEQIAVRELQHLDEETESLTAEQSHLENQKKRREGAVLTAVGHIDLDSASEQTHFPYISCLPQRSGSASGRSKQSRAAAGRFLLELKTSYTKMADFNVRYRELSVLAVRETGPLLKGLRSFNSLSEMLLSTNADIILPGCQTFDDIREEIKEMKQHLEESEQIAVRELQHLDKETESLTAEQSNLENQKRRREGELEDLKLQLDSHRSSLKTYNEALETEKNNLQSAERTLRDMRRKKDEAEEMKNFGIGLMFIPFIGLIPGAVLTAVGQTDLDSASEQVDRARSEIQRCESQITSYSNLVSRYEGSVSQAQNDIQEANRKIYETWLKLQTLSVTRTTVADFQSKTRRAAHQLGLLCGVGSVAELQTRRLILLEPVMNVMEEMMEALGRINKNDQLYSENMQSIMWDVRNNQSMLKNKLALCIANSDEDYY